MKLFVNCEKAGHYCDKCQYEEAGFWEKLKLRFHVAVCHACKKHAQRNKKLTQLLQNPKVKKMPESCRKRLLKEIDQELTQ